MNYLTTMTGSFINVKNLLGYVTITLISQIVCLHDMYTTNVGPTCSLGLLIYNATDLYENLIWAIK